MTLGERRIGTFNPSSDDYVSTVKRIVSDLIDYIDKSIDTSDVYSTSNEIQGEKARLKSIALSKLEEAAMFAVKAKMHFS